MKKIISLFLLFSFFVTGCYFNNGKFHKLEQELTNFLYEVNESNYFNIDISVKVDDEKVQQGIKMMNNPIYIETHVNDQTEIIAQENDKIFEYIVKDNNKVDRNFLGYLGDYNITENEESFDIVELTSFNKQKCKIKIEDNTYTITGLYKDLIDNESKEMFESVFKNMKSLLDELYNTEVTIKYIFEEDRLVMSISLTFIYEDISIYMEVIYDMYINSFVPINIYDGSYNITNPTNFEEAFELENLDVDIKCNRGEKVYYVVELEKGMLVANNKDAYFELYDMNKNLVSESLGNDSSVSIKELYPYMAVPEKGKYYLAIYKFSGSNQNVKISLYEYETILNDSIVNLNYVLNYEGQIEGIYDFERFVYKKNENTKEKSLKINNTGDNTIFLYRYNYSKNEGLMRIEPNSSYYLYLEEGENEFIICQDFISNSYSEVVEYSVNVETYDLYFGQSLSEREIPSLSYMSDKTKQYYYTYLKRGQYSFLDKNGSTNKLFTYVYDENGKSIDDANIFAIGYRLDEFASHFVIKEDEHYYVIVENNDDENKEVQFIRHNYTTFIDKSNPKLLDISGNPNNSGVLEGLYDFEYYVHNSNKNNLSIYKLTNKGNKKLGVAYKKYANDYLDYEYILPNYNLFFASIDEGNEITIFQDQTSSLYNSINYSFSVEELENNNVTDKYSNEIVELTENFTEKYYMAGYGLPATYFKINIKEKGLLSFYVDGDGEEDFWTGQFQLEDKNGNNISYKKEIEPGEYFVKWQAVEHVFLHVKIKYSLK